MLSVVQDLLRRRLRWLAGYYRIADAAPALIFAWSLLFPFGAQGQVNPVRRVLILYESSPNSPLVGLVDRGIEAALNGSPYQVEYHSEYLETASFPDPAEQRQFRDFYLRKYHNRQPDVIIAVGPSPLRFMFETHKESFPGVPVIFCLPNRVPGGFAVDSDFTGVEGDIAPAQTLNSALKLRPDTIHVVVVSGVTPFDRQQLIAVKDQLRPYESHLDISYLTDLSMSELLERLRRLPSHTIVIQAAFGRDANGVQFTTDQSGPLIVSAANAPVFSLNDRSLNHGEVGGDVANASAQGKIAGLMALKVIGGARPSNIPTVKDEATYEFDWRALKRWGMKEKNLPPGSIILNRPPSFWDVYRKFILLGIFILLAQMVAIIALLWQRAKRRKTEAELVRSHERLRQSMETGQSVGWDWDIASGRDYWFGDLKTMFGIPSDAFSAQIADFYRYVHPEDREVVAKAVADAKQSGQPYAAEFRIVRNDGSTCWVASRGAFEYDAKGQAMRMRGMAVNITERKLIEQALKKSEEKFAKAFRRSPLAFILSSLLDNRLIEVNDTFERYTGWSRDEVIGKTAKEIGIWVDLAKRSAFIEQLRAKGEVRNLEVELHTKDGLIKTFLLSAEVIAVNGEPCALALFADITEVKLAELARRESEERFRLVANSAPVMIWMTGPDGLCTYVNQTWLDFTGRPLHEELGEGWATAVHPEDFQRCLEGCNESFERRESHTMEYRLRRKDGQYRWILDYSVPRFNADGSLAGYIGSGIDVTERKQAEAALAGVSRKLIEVQEQERRRIARELHDDICQRLALLAVDIGDLQEEPWKTPDERDRRLDEVNARIDEISAGVQSISRQLHSPQLEYLGMVPAMRSFCSEFSRRQGMEVDFTHDDVPNEVPIETSLCLFRILQEALHNAAKYSQVRRFEVRLGASASQIHLTITDHGVGFDPEIGMYKGGLGLISMQERVRLVDGTMQIQSKPMAGTTVRVIVPFVAPSVSERAAS
jgi:PAS domain S-box-containing protein